jgi:thiaminase (transcriptional activator TenA)
MSFGAEAFATIAPIYAAILDHSFNRELIAGTLAHERFVHYMIQDAHYLNAFARSLAVLAGRAPDNGAMVRLAGGAREAVLVERALHESFFARFGVTPAQAALSPPSPVCAHYGSWLLATACVAPFEVGVAAVLPCFRVYWEVGEEALRTSAPGNPYRAWIDTYADPAFADGVRAMSAIADEQARTTTEAGRAAMLDAYVQAARLEWMFWDAAWRLETWPGFPPEVDSAAALTPR